MDLKSITETQFYPADTAGRILAETFVNREKSQSSKQPLVMRDSEYLQWETGNSAGAKPRNCRRV